MRSLRMWRWGDCPDYPDGPSIAIRVLKRWRRGGGGGGQKARVTERPKAAGSGGEGGGHQPRKAGGQPKPEKTWKEMLLSWSVQEQRALLTLWVYPHLTHCGFLTSRTVRRITALSHSVCGNWSQQQQQIMQMPSRLEEGVGEERPEAGGEGALELRPKRQAAPGMCPPGQRPSPPNGYTPSLDAAVGRRVASPHPS